LATDRAHAATASRHPCKAPASSLSTSGERRLQANDRFRRTKGAMKRRVVLAALAVLGIAVAFVDIFRLPSTGACTIAVGSRGSLDEGPYPYDLAVLFVPPPPPTAWLMLAGFGALA
jgi:hypothetical protein